jgi:hypothetical protein
MNIKEEDEDELIEEIDVCLSNVLKDEVYIFQYPLRPNDKPYGDHAELSSIMINKENSNVKMNYLIESKMKNFDIQYYEGKSFSQTLLGQKIEPNTNYCVGVYKNDILYINPVSTFIQFRNDFSHIEIAEMNRKKMREKPVAGKKENISNLDKENASADKWSNLKFHKKDTIQSYQIYEKLYFEDNIKPSKIEVVSEKEYYEFLFSNVNREVNLDKTIPDRNYSFKDFMMLPLYLRVEFLFKKLSVISFKNLILYSKAESTNFDSILEICMKYARILKNGSLILKSELRYDPNTKNDMCTKRNFLINLLQDDEKGIKKNEVKFLESNELSEILNEIAEKLKGFYFLKGFNESNESHFKFMKNFQSIYDNEMSYWNNIKKNNSQTNSINIINNSNKQQNENKVSNNDDLNIQSQLTSKINIEFLKSLINKYLSDSVCMFTIDLLKNLYNDMKINVDDSDNQEIKQIIDETVEQVCFRINKICYLREVGEGQALLSRKALIEFLAAKKSAKRIEIKNHLESLSLTVPDNLLTKLLKSISVSSSNMWSLKEPS